MVDPLDVLRAGWRDASPGPDADQLGDEDLVTQRVVGALQELYARLEAAEGVTTATEASPSRWWSAAAAVLLATLGYWLARPVAPVEPLPPPPAGPRVVETTDERTVLRAGVVRLTLLNPDEGTDREREEER